MITNLLGELIYLLREIPKFLLLLISSFGILLDWAFHKCVFATFDWASYKKIPGPPSDPILGHARLFNVPSRKRQSIFIQLGEKYGPVYQFSLFSNPKVVLSSPSAFETVMGNTKYINKGTDYDLLHSWLGDGLLLASTNTGWQGKRKMLTPAFHFKILERYLEIMNEHTKILKDEILAPLAEDNKTFDAWPVITNCALDIICNSSMGYNIDAQHNAENSTYIWAIRRHSEITIDRIFKPQQWNNAIFKLFYNKRYNDSDKCLKIMHDFTNSVITERKAEYKERRTNSNNDHDMDDGLFRKKKLAFLDILLHATETHNLTDEYLRAEVDTFMFEGHDTTANAMSFATYLLARYPEVQTKVRKELDEIFGDDLDRPCTMDDLAQMKYLSLVIKETLRLYPIVPLMSRISDEDIIIEGIKVPARTEMVIIADLTHRNEKWFPNPNKFDPERWNNAKDELKQHPYAYIPFSAGSRNCIGQKFALMEMKTLLSTVLRNYEISTEVPFQTFDAAREPEVVLRPGDGVLIKAKKRCLEKELMMLS